MALSVVWSQKARQTFLEIINYLQTNWTDREVNSFVKATDRIVDLASTYPNLFSLTGKKKNTHRSVISKHTSLFYRVKKNRIELITFWDNRRNPKLLKV